ncbi:PfkB family carbohydrate kinase [Chondromyces apiculatus]|nr:PfkB family carbohydrate kinase [Chondromyces apiculatus]
MSMESQNRAAGSARSFDVICAGEALWDLTEAGGVLFGRSASLRFKPGGGAVNAALALAQGGLCVGLATALTDDTFGRTFLGKIAAAGIDVGGVVLAPRYGGLLRVEGIAGARTVVSTREGEVPITVPPGWTSTVLLLSGLSPVLARAAALCKAARAARRQGTLVVVDVNARWHLWVGQDQRAIRSVLREADVVRCSAADLEVLRADAATVRGWLRPAAVLVLSNGAGDAWATGTSGEIALAPRGIGALRPKGAGDVFTAAICAELSRAGHAGEGRSDLWERALQRGHAAVMAQASVR